MFHASLLAACVACNPWPSGLAGVSLQSLPPSSHVFSLCLCPFPPSYKDSRHWLEGPPSSTLPSPQSHLQGAHSEVRSHDWYWESGRTSAHSVCLELLFHLLPNPLYLVKSLPPPSSLWGTGVWAEATPLTLSERLCARAGHTVGQTLLLFKTRSYSEGAEALDRNAASPCFRAGW